MDIDHIVASLKNSQRIDLGGLVKGTLLTTPSNTMSLSPFPNKSDCLYRFSGLNDSLSGLRLDKMLRNEGDRFAGGVFGIVGHYGFPDVCIKCGLPVVHYELYVGESKGNVRTLGMTITGGDARETLRLLECTRNFMAVPLCAEHSLAGNVFFHNNTPDNASGNYFFTDDEDVAQVLSRYSASHEQSISDCYVEKGTVQNRIWIKVPDEETEPARDSTVQAADPSEWEALSEIAQNGEDPAERMAALNRLPDEITLHWIATFGKHLDTCLEALNRIQDQRLIAEILGSYNKEVAEAALSRLSDQAVIIEAAQGVDTMGRRTLTSSEKGLFGLIEDQQVLADFATTATKREVRAIAIKLIKDRQLLKSLACLTHPTHEKELRKLVYEQLGGGYVCSSCKAEIVSETGESISCICPHCQTDNHDFVSRQDKTMVNSTTENFDTWNECERCGLTKDHDSFTRFTDY